MMFDVQQIVEAVVNVGFPVVACCYMAHINAKQIDDFRNDNRYEAELHKEENAKLQESLVNNTVTLTKLTSLIESEVSGRERNNV